MSKKANQRQPPCDAGHRQGARATEPPTSSLTANQAASSGTGFQPVNPWKSEAIQARWRNLPHLQAPEATYLVTFRCQSGVTRTPEARWLVLSAVRHWDGQRIALDAAVVMPDHVHALFRIIDGSWLEQILHSMKSFSAKQVKKLYASERNLPSYGWHLWLDESFDRIIRSEAEWQEKLAYISENPARAALVKNPGDYDWLYLAGKSGDHRQDACATQPG
jgi:REP element-mobilizing transposase RayT